LLQFPRKIVKFSAIVCPIASNDTFFQDLRLGWRRILRNPGLTLVIILSPGLGLGAPTAVFSVSSTLLLRPLPYPQQDRLAIREDPMVALRCE